MMNNFFRLAPLVALVLGSPLLLRAQSGAAPGGWQKAVGLSFTPTWNYRTLQGGSDEAFMVHQRNGAETARPGFDAGAGLRLSRGPHLRLEAGLGWASRGYRAQVQLSDWLPTNPTVSTIATTYRYQFLTVPLQASYAVGRGRLQGFVGGGVSLDFLLGVHTKQRISGYGRTDEAAQTETAGYNRWNLTPRLTAGLRYALTPTYAVELAPVLQYSLLESRAPRTAVREHLYSGGVTLAVYRNI